MWHKWHPVQAVKGHTQMTPLEDLIWFAHQDAFALFGICASSLEGQDMLRAQGHVRHDIYHIAQACGGK